jgi:hypothetical protein
LSATGRENKPDGLTLLMSEPAPHCASLKLKIEQTNLQRTMSQLIVGQALELLDRKYQFVVESPVESFMLDLQQFIKFLTDDGLVKDFTGKILNDSEQKFLQYQSQLQRETLEAIEIKKAPVNKYPDIDDSNMPSPEPNHSQIEYERSFAGFDGIVNKHGAGRHRSLFPDPLDDQSDVARLLSILRGKVGQLKDSLPQAVGESTSVDEIDYRLSDLEERHKFTHIDWVNYCRVSPSLALRRLLEIEIRINPQPEGASRWRELSTLERLNEGLDTWLTERRYSWIQDLTYGVYSKYGNYRPNKLSQADIESIIRDRKEDLRRVYEAVRQEIGTTRLHFQTLDRYRTRCHWYNQEYLRKQVLTLDGTFVRDREDILTRDLALYLYDQGVTVIYKTKLGKHEVDLLELDAKYPMFIEAKAYKDSSAKGELVSGIGQLHAYLSSYEAHKNISEAFYVIFRLAGPIYELPRIIRTNRFTIYTVLIDLGLSSESGRRQPKPTIISEEEVLSIINRLGNN